MRRGYLASRSVAAVGWVVLLLLGACGGTTDDRSVEVVDAAEGEADHRYVIPEGAGEAIDRGEPLDVLPRELDVRVGEIIEIVNEDSRGHLVGPFFVDAHGLVRQQFSSPGVFEGICSVHPSGQVVLTVSP